VESESQKIGQLRVPESLIERMHRHGRCLVVCMPDEARVQLLLEEYGHFASDVEGFCRLIDGLVELRGKDTVRRWQAQAREGQWAAVFGELMMQHYDPLYERSMQRHFEGLASAQAVDLADGGLESLRALARQLVAR